MNTLVRRSNELVSTGPDRATGRALAKVEQQTSVELALIEQAVALQDGRIQALGIVARRAMEEVAMISQFEQQFATLVPLATTRLQAIGDTMAFSAANIVADTGRRVG